MQLIATVTVKHSGVQLNVSEQSGVMYLSDKQHSMSLCAPISKIKFDSEGSIYYQASRRERWAIELDEHDYSLLSAYVSERKLEIKNAIVKKDVLVNSGKGMSVSIYSGDEE
ncbi:TPA: hypothetical protein ACW72Z_002529 [Aeromonas veronii]|uniref:hypothetical protein n=1 Tax=Aeromonas veronii TaxID=654 RepID=UPI0038D5C9DB